MGGPVQLDGGGDRVGWDVPAFQRRGAADAVVVEVRDVRPHDRVLQGRRGPVGEGFRLAGSSGVDQHGAIAVFDERAVRGVERAVVQLPDRRVNPEAGANLGDVDAVGDPLHVGNGEAWRDVRVGCGGTRTAAK